MNKKLSLIKKITLPILKKNDVVEAGIFGSYARGENSNNSDIDMIIRFKGRKSLFDLVGLKMDLEKKLKKKVDLLTYKSIHPLLKESILNDEVKILK